MHRVHLKGRKILDYEKIILHLLPSKYDVQFKKNSDQGYLLLKTLILGEEVTLVHYCVSEFEGLPQFCLEEADKYGVLAHVLPDKEKGTGSICLNAPESVSVNFDRPELAFEESLNRHFDLLGKALSNPEWNREELLREFASNWVLDFSSICGVLLCASAPGRLEEVSIVDAARAKKKDLLPYYMAVSEKDNDLIRSHYMQGKSNQRQEKAIGYVIPLASVEPPPQYNDDLGEWYIDALNRIVPERQGEFKRCYTQFRSNQFWIVFNAPTPSGITWFGLRLKCDVKKTLPIKKEKITGWHFQKFIVRIFNKESIMPRSGANPILDRKKVLLIGCGSVGSEIALMLGSAGLGHIDLADPDIFQISNIYRHTLSMYWLNYFKSLALSVDLKARFPWINTGYSSKRLLSYRNTINAKEYDLIIIAIGSPTHERLFHKFLQENKVNIPVINTWLEGYGIGGHATLDIPISKGCLLCAYVENATGIRGLASNLNFFEADQDIAINYAGCGELFLPYGAISSAQTALIASDLAIHYLEGKITESKKVSWKGDSTEALEQGIYE